MDVCIPAASLREKESHQSAASGGGKGAITPAGRAFSGWRFRRLAPLSGAMTRRRRIADFRRRDQEKKGSRAGQQQQPRNDLKRPTQLFTVPPRKQSSLPPLCFFCSGGVSAQRRGHIVACNKPSSSMFLVTRWHAIFASCK